MDPSTLLPFRIQFALTASYHFLFVPLSIGVLALVAVLDTRHAWRPRRSCLRASRYWSRFFVLAWAMGALTGFPLREQLHRQWHGFSEQAMEALRATTTLEGIIAPLMLVLVLGLALAADRLGAVARAVARWSLLALLVCQSASILALNAWMQHPVATEVVHDRMHVSSAVAMFLNPTALWKLSHTMGAAVLTGSMLVIAVSSWLLRRRRRRYPAAARLSITVALPMAAIALAAVIWTGHHSASDVYEHQPMKFAAMEAHWARGDSASAWTVVGWPDATARTNRHAVEVPYVLSWMVGTEEPLSGLNEHVERARREIAAGLQAPGSSERAGWRQLYEASARRTPHWSGLSASQRIEAAAQASLPNVPVIFTAFRVMVGSALLLAVALGWSLWRWRRAGNDARAMPWMLWLCAPLPWIAMIAGWVVAEVGRQPWVVYERLTTASAAAPVPAVATGIQFVVFALGYGVLTVVCTMVMSWLVRLGPRRTVWPAAWRHAGRELMTGPWRSGLVWRWG
jgi:cytochrome d ubiquinol oxidase subunit I